MEYQTDLTPIFHLLSEHVENLVWLISYHEFYYLNDDTPDKRLNPIEQLIRISGKELKEIVDKHQIQFVWGVLSGCNEIPKIEQIDMNKLNLSNYGAEAFVYDDAVIEIDCFDSTFTTIRCKSKEILEQVSNYFEVEIQKS